MPWKITPSLYNAWLFYRYPLFDRDEQQEKDARDEMLRVLRKEKSPETPEQERGHIFENTIEFLATGKCNPESKILAVAQPTADDMNNGADGFDGIIPVSEDDPEYKCAREIAENCIFGLFQEKDGKELPSGNYIYGVADCILPTTIVDFKRVGAGKYEQGKYQKSIQHLAYMYIWDTKRFDYLVCDGSAEPFDEFYTWSDSSLGLLESRIAMMIHEINCDEEMAKIFLENWEYKSQD